MPPKIKSSNEDRLAQQRLCKRRQYAEIKKDPQLLALAREKRRAKYLKDKKDGKINSISKKSARVQREQRKKWKDNSKRYRQRKKESAKLKFESIQIQAVSEEQDIGNFEDLKDPLHHNCPAVQVAVRKVRYTELKKRQQLMKIIGDYIKRNKAYCRQIERLKKKLQITKFIIDVPDNSNESDASEEIEFLDSDFDYDS